MAERLLGFVRGVFFTALIVAIGADASAQTGATASLSGTVVDTSGAVIPGADIVVKNNATGVEFTTHSDAQGIFSLPALPPGTYTLTTTLMGFKKQVHPNIVLNVGVQATLKVTLEVGGLEEIITVTGGTDIVQTQSTTISQTINSNQIENLPLVSRDAINALTVKSGRGAGRAGRPSRLFV